MERTATYNYIHFSLLMRVQANVHVISPLAQAVKGNKMANLAAVKNTLYLVYSTS